MHDHSYFEDENDPIPCYLTFIYSEIIKFESTGKIKGAPLSKNFIDNIKGILNNKIKIHHLPISNEVISYAHSFCNAMVKEN